MVQKINLPTYEQVANIEKTSGAVMGSDGNKYLTNFDEQYKTMKLIDTGNGDVFRRSFMEKISPDIDPNLISMSFIYVNDNVRFTFGTTVVTGTSRMWYAFVDANTFEVLGGKIVTEGVGITVPDASNMSRINIVGKHLWATVTSPMITFAIIDMETYSFVKFLKLETSVTSISHFCVSPKGFVATILNESYPQVRLWKYPMDVNGVPTIDVMGQNSVNIHALQVNAGSAWWFSAASIILHDDIIYVSGTPSGTMAIDTKLQFNMTTNVFTVLATFQSPSAPNPVPPVSSWRIAKLTNGTRILIKYHLNPSNGSYRSIINLDTFTSINSANIGKYQPSLLQDGDKIYLGGDSGGAALFIGNAYYIPYHSFEIDMTTGNPKLPEYVYIMATFPPSQTAHPIPAAYPSSAGIANKKGVFLSPSSGSRFRDTKRTYNIINYSKEVD